MPETARRPPTVCLNMIVRNESAVIRRCLDSVRPLIDSWVIVDTGSEDGTQAIIREHLSDLPGELHERPWRNFGHNRSEALQLAKGRADYLLIMDADDVMHLPAGFVWPETLADANRLRFVGDGISYRRPVLIRSAIDWRYVGVLHECLDSPGPHTRAIVEGPIIHSRREGYRSRQDPVAKYSADAEVLEQALRDEPDNPRYVFYLAQSYRDSKQYEKAIAAYQRRIDLGGRGEEVWQAWYMRAQLFERVGRDDAQVIAAYLDAWNAGSRRAEPLYRLARFCRQHGPRWELAHLFASAACSIAVPADALFLEDAVYAWHSREELAAACWATGRYRQGIEACEAILATPGIPVAKRKTVQGNLEKLRDKLAASTATPVG